MMNECGASVRNNNRHHPFTASQWQQLEHQALVYKYLISGVPIPPHLLFTIEASLQDSSTNLILHHQPPHPSIGWNCFQMGFGRKIDPEPGRCRRTDGKKWRCSKEAYPDSKYCERHMHRGRNRSRKPVEVNMSTPLPIVPCTKSPNYPSPNSHPSSDYHTHVSNVLSPQHHFLLERKSYGMKGEMDAHSFFSESSGTSTLSEYNQNQGFYYDQLGLKFDRKDEPQKVMHHFFDEWPPNDDDSSTTTQLSISIPSSSSTARDFFLAHNDK